MEGKFITVTSLTMKGGKIHVNINHIGHFYGVPAKEEYGRITKEAHTRLGVTTHNNGGFEVVETPEEIMKKIKIVS